MKTIKFIKKTSHKNHEKTHSRLKNSIKTPRRLQKSEVSYSILENTMRGYFNYSV